MAEEKANFGIWNQRDLGVNLSVEQILEFVSDADIEYVCGHVYKNST